MMMRSAPPSCAHLADSPVPAPAPITGRPWATCSRSAARASSRVIDGSPPRGVRPRVLMATIGILPLENQLVQPIGHRGGEHGVVDIGVDLVDLDLAGIDALAQRGEERLVGLGVVERLALDVDGGDALQGDEED